MDTSHWKIPGKSGKFKKVDPFSRLELSQRNFVFHLECTRFSYFISVSVVTNSEAILVSHWVTGSAPFQGLRSNGTTFYLSENPFFSHWNFRILLPKWKTPQIRIWNLPDSRRKLAISCRLDFDFADCGVLVCMLSYFLLVILRQSSTVQHGLILRNLRYPAISLACWLWNGTWPSIYAYVLVIYKRWVIS